MRTKNVSERASRAAAFGKKTAIVASTALVVLFVVSAVLAHTPAYQGAVVARRVKADLAKELGVSNSKVAVIAVERSIWPDADLGVREGTLPSDDDSIPLSSAYEEQSALPLRNKTWWDEHPGHRVTLRVAGETYIYHTAEEPYLLFRVWSGFKRIEPSVQ